MSSRAKRRRVSSDKVHESDAECEAPALPGAAERKRELERNRRNLVNVRFAELENQLARLPGAPTRVSRRIDKEVVLKDAAVAVATQQRELEHANSRLQTMTAEIESLRSEKMELRRDKTYLYNELKTAKSDVASLSNDNRMLWVTLKNCGVLKDAISADFFKVPIDLVLGQTTNASRSDRSPNNAQSRSSRAPSAAANPTSAAVFLQDPLNLGLDQQSSADAASSLAAIFSTETPDFAKHCSLASPPQTTGSSIMMQFALPESADNTVLNGDELSLADGDQPLPDVAPCG